MITVKILKRSADGRPTLYATRDLDVLPVSIGRDASCTIPLEDPLKRMSRQHVEIQKEGGAYWMAVVSKVNPVMAKGTRYGPGARLSLQSGDSFEIAEYEVHVLLPQPAPAAAKPEDAERLFNESTFGGGDEAAPRQAPVLADDLPPEATFIPTRAAPAPAVPPSYPLRAFFEGASLAPRPLSPMQTDRILRDCGAILRAAMEGLTKLLRARAETRSSLRLEERTTDAAQDNNPLKLMSDPGELMDFLFDPGERTDGFLDPVRAVQDACDDLRSHELALIAGMRAAILGVLRRLDPATLERDLEKGKGSKAKLWDLLVEEQASLARDAKEDFNKVFGPDFLEAYQAELQRLKGRR
jgi:predicted component of type VI protein secretion system